MKSASKKAKGLKRSKLDILFSQLVRERANWTCEACGKYYPEGQRRGLHCSHLFSRRYSLLRWHPENAVAHCYSCHQFFTGNPILFAEWMYMYVGRPRLDMLMKSRCVISKLRAPQYEDIYFHMKTELARGQNRRAEGYLGRLEFMIPPVIMEALNTWDETEAA